MGKVLVFRTVDSPEEKVEDPTLTGQGEASLQEFIDAVTGKDVDAIERVAPLEHVSEEVSLRVAQAMLAVGYQFVVVSYVPHLNTGNQTFDMYVREHISTRALAADALLNEGQENAVVLLAVAYDDDTITFHAGRLQSKPDEAKFFIGDPNWPIPVKGWCVGRIV
jgi:hypothetical protein